LPSIAPNNSPHGRSGTIEMPRREETPTHFYYMYPGLSEQALTRHFPFVLTHERMAASSEVSLLSEVEGLAMGMDVCRVPRDTAAVAGLGARPVAPKRYREEKEIRARIAPTKKGLGGTSPTLRDSNGIGQAHLIQAGEESEPAGVVTAEQQVVMPLDHAGIRTIRDLDFDIGGASGGGWHRMRGHHLA